MRNYRDTKKRKRERTTCPFAHFALLFLFGFFVSAGCERNPIDDLEVDERHVVMIRFAAKPLSGSLSKSAATPEEDLIKKIIMFGVNNQGNIIETFELSSDTSLTIARKITWLYAIANPTDSIEAATPSNISDLMDMTCDYSDAPQSPFLMSGKSEVIGASVNIELVRAVAKIEIVGNNFQADSVFVIDAPAKGYVFSRDPFSAPVSDRVTYSYSGSSSIYVAENSKQNPLNLFVTGLYEGEFFAYTITPSINGEGIDIVRNTYYKIDIIPNTAQ